MNNKLKADVTIHIVHYEDTAHMDIYTATGMIVLFKNRNWKLFELLHNALKQEIEKQKEADK